MKNLLIISLYLFSLNIYSQEVERLTFHSPEAASFKKYGDHPVSLFTGTPEISIPLFSFSEGSLKENISLSYHAGGIRVGQKATWVGLGWNLNVGGMITRNINGGDDLKDSYSYFYGSYYWNPLAVNIPSAPNSGTTCSVSDPNVELDIVEGRYDREPDEFSYSFAGRNGKFVFDRYGNVHLFPKNDLSIEVQNYGMEFIITDENGIRYYFGENANEMHQTEVLDDSPFNGFSMNTKSLEKKISWFLTRIESPSGEDYINFNYTSNKIEYVEKSSESKSWADLCDLGYYYTRYFVKNYVDGYVLSSIESNNYQIEFHSYAGRLDVNGAKVLDRISIKNNSELLKTISFETSYFNCSTDGSPDTKHQAFYNGSTFDTKRLRLDAVKEYNGDIEKEPYTFKYFEEINLPRRLTFAEDLNGLYNGKNNNNTLLPKLESLQGCTLYNKLGDRSHSWPEAKSFILEQITYPTGGKTDFEYESNGITEGGIRIRSSNSRGEKHSQTTRYEYAYPTRIGYYPFYYANIYVKDAQQLVCLNGKTPGMIQSFPFQGLSNFIGNYVAYPEVSTIKEGNGRVTTTFNIGEQNYWIEPGFPEGEVIYDAMNGTVDTEEGFDNEGNKVYRIANTYETNFEEAINNKDTSHGWIIDLGNIGCDTGYTVDLFPVFCSYSIYNNWITKEQTEKTFYFESGNVTTKTESASESNYHNYPSESVNYDSAGNKIITRTTYSTDIRFETCDENLSNTLSQIGASYLINNIYICDNPSLYNSNFRQKRNDIIDAYSIFNDCISSAFTTAGNRMQTVSKMQDQNIIKPLETLKYISYKTSDTTWGEEKLVGAILYEYVDNNNKIELSKVSEVPFSKPTETSLFTKIQVTEDLSGHEIITDTSYQGEVSYTYYAERLVEYRKANDIPISYVWSYNNQHPIIEIVGISHQNLIQYLGVTFIEDVKNTIDTNAIDLAISSIRQNPNLSNTHIKSYKYKQGVGIQESSNQNGHKTFFNFDELGRLIESRDNDNNVLIKNKYHYKGQ